jgi:hypothetical protein
MAIVLVRRNTEQTRSIGISTWGNDHHRQVPTKSRKTDANVCPSSFRRWNTHHRGGLGAPSLGGQVTLMFTARRSVGGTHVSALAATTPPREHKVVDCFPPRSSRPRRPAMTCSQTCFVRRNHTSRVLNRAPRCLMSCANTTFVGGGALNL